MKRFLICLFSFLFIGCSIAGGAVLLSNSSYSDEYRGGDSSNSENDVTKNAPTNDDLWTDYYNFSTRFAGGSGTSTNPYQIATAGQLAYLAYLINSSSNSTYKDLYYVQTANIDLSAHYWDPIGSYTSESSYFAFSGNFDGGDYIISGIYTEPGSSETYSYQGLFGYLYNTDNSNAVIHDVNIEDSNIQGYSYIGGIAGYVDGVDITNCSFLGNVTATGHCVGGIAGLTRNSETEYCVNYGSITSNCTESVDGLRATAGTGGIIGYQNGYAFYNINYGNISGDSGGVGGIVGRNMASLNYNYNIGNITGSSYAGGIAGGGYTVYHCYNKGNVTSSSSRAGGIIGGVPTNGSVSYCYNTGNIVGGSDSSAGIGVAGGIIGYAVQYTSISNCFNIGSVSAGWEGGILAFTNNSAVRNCYWGLNCAATDAVGRGLSTTVENCDMLIGDEITSVEWYLDSTNWRSNVWNFTTIWAIIDGENDGLPILQGLQSEEIIMIYYNSNYGTNEISYGYKYYNEDITIRGDVFTRDGYVISNWNTSADGTGVSYQVGDTYSENVDLMLYAQWRLPITMISLDWAGIVGGEPSEIYLWTDDGYYLEEGCINKIEVMEFPTDNGFTFYGFYSGTNGTGEQLVDENGNFLTVSTTITLWHAYFIPNLSAMYDENGYWYVELGMMPQSRVTDDAIITALNGTGLTSGNNYRFGDLVLESSVYGNEEYCEYKGNWYRVEPIRWRLDYSTSQTVGFGTTEDTLAVMDTIVFVSQFSATTLNSGDGYSTTAVTNLLDSFADIAYFETETKTMLTFGSTTINGTAESVTSNIFVASREEIAEVAGNGKIQFSDLVKDYLLANGQMPLYYTRDLGTNYNNIFCMNSNGESVQYKPQNYFGVQFSVLITEYACIN